MPYVNEFIFRVQNLTLRCCHISSVGQRVAKLLSSNFENDLNQDGLEPNPKALARTLAVMTEAADLFLRPPTLTELVTLTCRPYNASIERCKPFPKTNQEFKRVAAFQRYIGFATSKFPQFHRAN